MGSNLHLMYLTLCYQLSSSFQIEPSDISENCFWLRAKEGKFENPDLFAKLALTFATQMKGNDVFFE